MFNVKMYTLIVFYTLTYSEMSELRNIKIY